jgi:hypothetical protein
MVQTPKQTLPKGGQQVLDTKSQDTAKTPSDNRVQVHQGNVPVLTVHFLSRIADSLERIAKVMESDG